VGVPVKDTIKEVEAGLVRATPDRQRLWQAQTPQAFRFATIRDAHERAWREGFRGTDDAVLLERLGLPVAMVEGDYRNIKITTPEDLVLARALLAATGGA
jgi:2-C-methyl-D-erythritol 4-phosphate cytidylyltransferase